MLSNIIPQYAPGEVVHSFPTYPEQKSLLETYYPSQTCTLDIIGFRARLTSSDAVWREEEEEVGVII